MPWPENLATAKEVEQVVRDNGAVPATIAILDGVIHVGLDEAALTKLAKLGTKAHKTSRRDLAYVQAKALTGATTVSATSLIAARAGIHIFATGGIGGVHRYGETTMDISADLTELGRTPITVVCAGAKSFLDIERTLEYLETQGVAVIGYETDDFPAFYVRKSGVPVPLRLDSADDCAKLIYNNIQTNLQSGNLIAVPIPHKYEADAASIESAIQTTLKLADQAGIKGKEVTPFVLGKVSELTKGHSLASNIQLVKNNAAVASRIAAVLSKLLQHQQQTIPSRSSPQQKV
eukprot:TRINITY_DN5314_c0_g2_i1.p1 TRINITY_DN5314_c0_g2~~TRINITY_DN5314_c0_g2_i1.p1  ORF type:complete len:291 (+),score=68.80 TRINITY_DN5314_c0_g2_i1:316-1188(+)